MRGLCFDVFIFGLNDLQAASLKTNDLKFAILLLIIFTVFMARSIIYLIDLFIDVRTAQQDICFCAFPLY